LKGAIGTPDDDIASGVEVAVLRRRRKVWRKSPDVALGMWLAAREERATAMPTPRRWCSLWGTGFCRRPQNAVALATNRWRLTADDWAPIHRFAIWTIPCCHATP